MSIRSEIYQSDCLEGLKRIESASVDLVYLDPPFFTNRSHKLSKRGGGEEFSFDDLWAGHSDYAEFLHKRCREFQRVLKDTGSIFFIVIKLRIILAGLCLTIYLTRIIFNRKLSGHISAGRTLKRVFSPLIKQYYSIQNRRTSNSIRFILNIQNRPMSIKSCNLDREIVRENRHMPGTSREQLSLMPIKKACH